MGSSKIVDQSQGRVVQTAGCDVLFSFKNMIRLGRMRLKQGTVGVDGELSDRRG